MNIDTKYYTEQTVYLMDQNAVQVIQIKAIHITVYTNDKIAIMYSTTYNGNMKWKEEYLFKSKQDLLDSL